MGLLQSNPPVHSVCCPLFEWGQFTITFFMIRTIPVRSPFERAGGMIG